MLIELMAKQRYGVEYQPIVDISNQEIYAYECLSRFFDAENIPIRPDLVYASLHDSPISLFQVEHQQKKLQLCHAPDNVDIFVNLDQDSYFSTGALKDDNPFLNLFKGFEKPVVNISGKIIKSKASKEGNNLSYSRLLVLGSSQKILV